MKKIMKILSVIIVIILVCILFYVFTYNTNDHQTNRVIDFVSLSVETPFSTALLSFYDNGVISYFAHAPEYGIDNHTDSSNISQSQYQELIESLENNDFWTLDDSVNDSLQNTTLYTITVGFVPSSNSPGTDAGSDSVQCNTACSNEFMTIINKMKELWGKEVLEI